MKKSGQLTVFILIGLIIVIGAVSALVLLNRPRLTAGDVSSGIDFQDAVNEITTYRQECIESSVNSAIDDYGLDASQQTANWLEKVISQRVYNCLDLSDYTSQGYLVEEDPAETDITISEDSIVVEVYYPITITSPGTNKRISLKEQSYIFPRESSTKINDGEITFALSTDKRFELIIPEGVSFEGANGQTLNRILIKVLDDQDLLGFENPYTLGNVYSVSDSTPSEPVEVRLRYDEENLLPGFRETDIAVAQYDSERGVWDGIPTEVDTENNIAKATVTHFSEIVMIQGTNINGNNSEWKDLWYEWPWAGYFIEHLHRPCRPYYEGSYSLGQGSIEPLTPESIDRFSGVLDKDKQSKYYGEENKFEERWYLNNFCDVELPFDGKGYAPHEPEKCGVVYLPPQVGDVLIRQPSAEGYDNGQQEYVYLGSKEELTYGELGTLANIFGANNPILAQGSELMGEDGSFTIGPIAITMGDRANGEFLPYILDENGVNPLNNPEVWAAVTTGRPNEYGEIKLDDWDEDDSDELIMKYCQDPKGSGLVSCVKCAGEACENLGTGDDIYRGLVRDELANACFVKCKERAEQLYSQLDGWAPWEVSGDGIIDFRWNGETLQRTMPECSLITEDIVNDTDPDQVLAIDIKGVASCNIETKDLATPLYYGYEAYKGGSELGYEGAGNNYYPVTNSYPLQVGKAVLPPSVSAIVTCTLGDECHALVNGQEIGVCAPTLSSSIFYEGKDMRVDPLEITGSCEFSFSRDLLKGGDNSITAWVVNKRTSEDVCAYVDVKVSLLDGRGEDTPYDCTQNPEGCIYPYCNPEVEECECEYPPCEDVCIPGECEECPPGECEENDGCPPETQLWHGKCKGNRGHGQEKQCMKTCDEDACEGCFNSGANPIGCDSEGCMATCDQVVCARADWWLNNRGKGQRTDQCQGPDANNPGCCLSPNVCVDKGSCLTASVQGKCFSGGNICCSATSGGNTNTCQGSCVEKSLCAQIDILTGACTGGNLRCCSSGGSGSCTPNWVCGDWSECANNKKQTRDCSDTNGCSNPGTRTESQGCTPPDDDVPEPGEEDEEGAGNGQGPGECPGNSCHDKP